MLFVVVVVAMSAAIVQGRSVFVSSVPHGASEGLFNAREQDALFYTL